MRWASGTSWPWNTARRELVTASYAARSAPFSEVGGRHGRPSASVRRSNTLWPLACSSARAASGISSGVTVSSAISIRPDQRSA